MKIMVLNYFREITTRTATTSVSHRAVRKGVNRMVSYKQTFGKITLTYQIDGLVQNCSNSIANVLELLQSCT